MRGGASSPRAQWGIRTPYNLPGFARIRGISLRDRGRVVFWWGRIGQVARGVFPVSRAVAWVYVQAIVFAGHIGGVPGSSRLSRVHVRVSNVRGRAGFAGPKKTVNPPS